MSITWIVDTVGLLAPLLFLYAYAMVATGKWASADIRFHLLNFLGAVFILLSMITHFNLPVFILEICWGTISVYGMVKARRA